MTEMGIDLEFYRGRRVFVTGHTGFKGSWMCKVLAEAGAEVTGYALQPPTEPSLFELAGIGGLVHSVIGDVRDLTSLRAAFDEAQPEIVIHMAAQPLVRTSYQQPAYTYEVNVMGTVNILECVRQSRSVRSFLNVTTDKVYRNREWAWGYRENEELNGFDPYSNSKSCSELVTESYRNSFFADSRVAISTARAGNVIGGGDFAADRIVPDCVRAAIKGEEIVLRNPHSIRPYQHVLEPVCAYLMIAARQYEDIALADSYNVGPDEESCVSTGNLAEMFCQSWGNGMRWRAQGEADAPHEANFLRLDCAKIRSVLGWRPRWGIEKAVRRTVDWTRVWIAGGVSPYERISLEMASEIRQYLQGG